MYFTTRRLLFELGGIQNTFALPGDPTFNKNNNRYDLPSYNRLCNEFKIDLNTDLDLEKVPITDLVKFLYIIRMRAM